jgi:threonine/homoserine/homoserine lactone efflux protein
MILRSRKRSNFIGNPSDGTRRISRRRAYVIGIATGLSNPRSALSVCDSLRSRSAGKPTLSIAGAAIARSVHWLDWLAGGMLIGLGLKLARESK